MKTLMVLALLAAGGTAALAQDIYGRPSRYPDTGLYGTGTGSNPNSHYVNPYTRQDGTFVQGHQQTNPNGTQRDNYGTLGNVNPYTGAIGTRPSRY
jgi:hypothetical protein